MYKEVNPAVFACVTFPFLFGVMFGDMGHGSLLMLAGILLCIFNSRMKGSSMEGFAQLRYLFLLMGIFGTYNGFIYNEFFAIPINFFGSCYNSTAGYINGTDQRPGSEWGYNRTSFDCVYTVGLDPIWAQSD
jgi:V-type H+-transporting ATPase subunit a